MNIFGILDTAKSGLIAQQAALEVTSENIANVNTPGYSKQTAILETAPTVTTNGLSLGTGVNVAGIQRSYDALLQQQIVNGNSAYGESSTKQTVLEQIQPSFNEINSNGLGQAMDDFFNSWQDLSVTPSGTPERQTVIARAQTLVDTFHEINTSLQSASSNADDALAGLTTDITDKAKNIASLNSQIQQTQYSGGDANELKDQRDYLVQEMANEVGVTYKEQSDGTLTVTLAGGQNLVQGTSYATLSTQKDGATGLNDIMFTPIGGGASADITSTVGGANNSKGQMGGYLQLRDAIIPGYLANLDEMANEMVTAVNTLHSSGYGLDGTQNNFFDPAGTTSADISLNPAIVGNPDKIAAATANPLATGETGDNTNASAIASIRSGAINFSVTVGGNTTSTSSTFSSFYSSFVSSVGVDTANATNTSQQNDSFLKQLNTLRDSNSGVSIDEELTNMIKYQQAFQASSKLVNTASQMLDTIINLVQ
ncbi:MAG TPA: flagellar hook-associated protein FlgK [Geobacteraceae bacterium]|nr:flagellar hook-associated protein FlgK [Geobacteraceae bacterium]